MHSLSILFSIFIICCINRVRPQRFRTLCVLRRGGLGRLPCVTQRRTAALPCSSHDSIPWQLYLSRSEFGVLCVPDLQGKVPLILRFIMGGTLLAPVGLVATETSAVLLDCTIALTLCTAKRCLDKSLRSLQMSPDFTGSPFYPKESKLLSWSQGFATSSRT